MTFYLDFGSFQLVNSTKALGVTMYKRAVVEWLIKLVPESFKTNQVFSMYTDDHLTELKSHKEQCSSLLISEIDKNQINYECELISIIGTVRDHYVNYSKRSGAWWLFDDHMCKELGSYSKVVKHMMQNQILPYVIMFRTKPSFSKFRFGVDSKDLQMDNVILEESVEVTKDEESKYSMNKYDRKGTAGFSDPYKNSKSMKKLVKEESIITNDPSSKGAKIDENLIITKKSKRKTMEPKKKTFVQKMLGLCGGGSHDS